MHIGMGEHPNVHTIRSAYDALVAGDLTTALRDLAPAAVFHFQYSGPMSGDRMGIDNIKAALVGNFEVTGGTHHFEISAIYADDQHGVVAVRETATRPDGALLDLDEVHLIAFDDQGRITDIWNLLSDPDVRDQFFSGR